MKNIFLLLILILTFLVTDQVKSFNNLVDSNKTEINNLKKKILYINKELRDLRIEYDKIKLISHNKSDSINLLILERVNTIDSVNNAVNIKINNIKYEENISNVKSFEKKLLFYCAIFCVFIIIVFILFFFISKNRISLINNSLSKQIIKIDEFIDQFMKKNNLNKIQGLDIRNIENGNNIDHSLALRVGEEIHRMRTRLDTMDSTTTGISALKSSLRRLEDEFNKQGYGIVELKDLPYDNRMTVAVKNIIPVEGLKKGEQKIVKVIKPQIVFKGVSIYMGDIEIGISPLDIV